MEEHPENRQTGNISRKASSYLHSLTKHYSGPPTAVALSALSAWTIVIGLKGLAGFTVNSRTALVDLLGIIIVIGALRWMQSRQKAK